MSCAVKGFTLKVSCFGVTQGMSRQKGKAVVRQEVKVLCPGIFAPQYLICTRTLNQSIIVRSTLVFVVQMARNAEVWKELSNQQKKTTTAGD